MAAPQPLRRSTRQAVATLNARYSDHTTQSLAPSSPSSEDDEPLRKRQKQRAGERSSDENETQPRLPSSRPQTTSKTSPSTFVPSSFVQSLPSFPAFDLGYPLRNFGFQHSLLQCMLICALKDIRIIGDNAPLTDDTVSLVLARHHGPHAQPVDTAAVYQYLRVKKRDQSNYAVQSIWRLLRMQRHLWGRTALTCYWNWMEYMKVIWNKYWMQGRQDALEMMCQGQGLEVETLHRLVTYSRPPRYIVGGSGW